MSESFTIVRFPSRKALFDALLSHCDNMAKRVVAFRVFRTSDPNEKVITLGMTINRIKRLSHNNQASNVWQFTGTLRTSDTYALEGLDKFWVDTPRLYVGGEFGITNSRITWSQTSKNIVVLSFEEFTLFQR